LFQDCFKIVSRLFQDCFKIFQMSSASSKKDVAPQGGKKTAPQTETLQFRSNSKKVDGARDSDGDAPVASQPRSQHQPAPQVSDGENASSAVAKTGGMANQGTKIDRLLVEYRSSPIHGNVAVRHAAAAGGATVALDDALAPGYDAPDWVRRKLRDCGHVVSKIPWTNARVEEAAQRLRPYVAATYAEGHADMQAAFEQEVWDVTSTLKLSSVVHVFVGVSGSCVIVGVGYNSARADKRRTASALSTVTHVHYQDEALKDFYSVRSLQGHRVVIPTEKSAELERLGATRTSQYGVRRGLTAFNFVGDVALLPREALQMTRQTFNTAQLPNAMNINVQKTATTEQLLRLAHFWQGQVGAQVTMTGYRLRVVTTEPLGATTVQLLQQFEAAGRPWFPNPATARYFQATTVLEVDRASNGTSDAGSDGGADDGSHLRVELHGSGVTHERVRAIVQAASTDALPARVGRVWADAASIFVPRASPAAAAFSATPCFIAALHILLVAEGPQAAAQVDARAAFRARLAVILPASGAAIAPPPP
jgi:hypothetical protein